MLSISWTEVWLKWYSALLASTKPLVQTPVLPKKERKKERKEYFLMYFFYWVIDFWGGI
jgi:hypothetical protein